jgi:hypothetical protein
MNANRVAVVISVLAMTVLSCRAADRDAGGTPATRPVAGRLKPIEYTKTGGIAGTREVITIASDGEIRASGRLLGKERHGTLTAAQVAELAALFEGWDQLRSDYDAPKGTADDFHFVVKHGDKSVSASEAATDLPPTLRKIAARLEQLARELPKGE